MGRLRVKVYAPHLPASPTPTFPVRAGHLLGEYADRITGLDVSVTGAIVDAAGAPVPWPTSRFTPVTAERLAHGAHALHIYAELFDRTAPPFDVLFLPSPWRCFPAGRICANPVPLVAFVPDLAFDDADQGSFTDDCRRTLELIARDCAAIGFPTEAIRDQAVARYGVSVDRTFLIPPAATVSAIRADAETIVRRLGLPSDFIVWLPPAGQDVDALLSEVTRHALLPWPVVVLGAACDNERVDLTGDRHGAAGTGRLFHLSHLTVEEYEAVLARSRAVVALTASPRPFAQSVHLDAMALQRPLFCQATADGRGWDGIDDEAARFFCDGNDLVDGLRQLRNDAAAFAAQVGRAERIARSRCESDQAREIFEICRTVHEAPLRRRIRFRTRKVVCREQRVAWLINHAALHAHEVPLIQSLGFEVYTPKRTPTSDFRSGAVALADDESSTLPRWVLERLNQHNFYESPLTDDLVSLLNSYFGTVILSSWGNMVREFVWKFRGRICVRAFGREAPASYHEYWDTFGGQAFWNRVSEIGHRFRLTPPYESIGTYEPEPLRRLSLTLPLGIADRVVRTANEWTGRSEQVLFVCPSINDSPAYYGKIYRDFKYHFGDLPHLIAGSQQKPVDDKHVLGYLPEQAYRRLLNDLRVMYYHSREPRHLHYHPLEAIVQGMPVVYLKGGLMETFGGPDQPGACDSEADARRLLRRILGGDRQLIDAIRSRQGTILEAFSNDHVRRHWNERFLGSIMSIPLTPGTRPPAAWIGRAESRIDPLPHREVVRNRSLRVGIYLRAVPGGGVFNYVTILVRKLAAAQKETSRFEVFLGRRARDLPFPEWPFEPTERLRIENLRDREYLPGLRFPPTQPSHVTIPDAIELHPHPASPSPPVVASPGGFRQRVKLGLRRCYAAAQDVRASHPSSVVRFAAAAMIASLRYGCGAWRQRRLRPTGTGAAHMLRHATDPDPAPLTLDQVREIATRNDVTFFAYPFDQVAADVDLDEVSELPIVVVMYDLAHEYSDTWGQGNLTIHREMHVWAKLARKIVFGSDHIRCDAVRRYGIPIEKTTVVTVPPLVARQEPATAIEVAGTLARLGLRAGYILNLGYQGPHKNNIVLLEAIKILRWRGTETPPLVLAGPEARALVLGNGIDAYSVRVRQSIQEAGLVEGRDLFVLDYVAADDVPGIYGGAAVCVSMSRSEAQIHGMILEAMLYERPLVCSDLPCNIEQLGTDDDYALIVPADDPAALADALTETLRHPTETRRRVERARGWIKSLGWQPVLDEYRRIFAIAAGQEVASEPDHRPVHQRAPDANRHFEAVQNEAAA